MENEEGETIRRQVRVTSEHQLLNDDPSMFVLLSDIHSNSSISLVSFIGFFLLIMRIPIVSIVFAVN